MSENSKKYLASKEAKKELKVQDFNLAHIRNLGNTQFTKQGYSYLYLKQSIEKCKKKNKIMEKPRRKKYTLANRSIPTRNPKLAESIFPPTQE